MEAEILTIGDELLRGEILDTNTICEPDNIASCEIKIRFFDIDNKKYCVAEAPRVESKVLPANGNSNKIKFVVWHLDKTDEDRRPLAFHGVAGIVITTEDKEQFVIPNSGGHGHADGTGGKGVYHVQVKRNIKAEVGYLPIVLWGEGDKAELCAAPDPKIGNN